MPLQDLKSINDFFKQLLMKRVEQAVTPKSTTAPQLAPSTAIKDLGARPEMTKPKMDLEFKGTTNPWSSMLVALGNINQMKNNVGRENEQAAQGDYTGKLKSAIDMEEDRTRKQNQMDFDVVDPNKIADRELKESTMTQNAWENFLKSEMAPLDIQKKQVDIAAAQDRMARAAAGGSGGGRPLTAGQQAEQARATTINGIFTELKDQYIKDKRAKEGFFAGQSKDTELSTEELKSLYDKAILLSGDVKYASRIKAPKEGNDLPQKRYDLAVGAEARRAAAADAKTKESQLVSEAKDIITTLSSTVRQNPALPTMYTITNPDGTKTNYSKSGLKMKLRQTAKESQPNLSGDAFDKAFDNLYK